MGMYLAILLKHLSNSPKLIFKMHLLNKKICSTAHIFSEIYLMKFSTIHKYFTLLLIFKTRLNNNSIFKLNDNLRNTRSNHVNLVCPAFRTTLFKNSVINFGLKRFSRPQEKKNPLHPISISIRKK